MTKTKKSSTKSAKAKAPEPRPSGSGGTVVTTLAGDHIPAAELAHIAPDLWPLVVSIDSLTPDPRNARLHNAQNLDAIARSLNDNGQLKALSTDADGVVLAGNGTLAAAKSLGWKYIARVRCNLTGPAARRWAIQDNRTAELAEWDQAELQNQVAQLEADLEGFQLDNLGFNDAQFDALLKGDVKGAHGFAPVERKPPKEPTATAEYKIIIDCRDEAEQREKIDKLLELGWEFTAPGMAAVE